VGFFPMPDPDFPCNRTSLSGIGFSLVYAYCPIEIFQPEACLKAQDDCSMYGPGGVSFVRRRGVSLMRSSGVCIWDCSITCGIGWLIGKAENLEVNSNQM
jgi:hypothetical protein